MSLKALADFKLTDGRKLNCNLSNLSFMNTLRKVYPKNSNSVTGYSFTLSLSLQYTILVFVGCNSNLHSSSRFFSFSRIYLAPACVLQWIMASSAYLSNGAFGFVRFIHKSKCVMHKKIRKYRAYDASLRCSAFAFNPLILRIDEWCFEPSFYVHQYP